MSDPRGLPYVWGATDAERATRYQCDHLLPQAQHEFYRAIDVDAPPAITYRWLQQLRIAPYSYDWVDNFALPSPSRLTARAERIAIGQRMMHVFSIVDFELGHSLPLGPRSRIATALLGTLYGTYIVTARGDGGSRLFVKVNANYPRSWYGWLVGGIMPWIDFVMMREQLRRLKGFAEASARVTPPRPPSTNCGDTIDRQHRTHV